LTETQFAFKLGLSHFTLTIGEHLEILKKQKKVKLATFHRCRRPMISISLIYPIEIFKMFSATLKVKHQIRPPPMSTAPPLTRPVLALQRQ